MILGGLPYFPEATDLKLSLNVNDLADSLDTILFLIDTPKISRIEMTREYFFSSADKKWLHAKSLFEEVPNLSDLVFETNIYSSPSDETINNLISILPAHIKHLTVAITALNQVETIMDRCKNLSSLKLYIRYKELENNVIAWFSATFIGVQYETGYRQIAVWVGRRKDPYNEAIFQSKRMKLSDDTLFS